MKRVASKNMSLRQAGEKSHRPVWHYLPESGNKTVSTPWITPLPVMISGCVTLAWLIDNPSRLHRNNIRPESTARSPTATIIASAQNTPLMMWRFRTSVENKRNIVDLFIVSSLLLFFFLLFNMESSSFASEGRTNKSKTKQNKS